MPPRRARAGRRLQARSRRRCCRDGQSCSGMTYGLSVPAKAGNPVLRSFANSSEARGLLDRPVKPGDDSLNAIYQLPRAVFPDMIIPSSAELLTRTTDNA